jgi:hypothetical protein
MKARISYLITPRHGQYGMTSSHAAKFPRTLTRPPSELPLMEPALRRYVLRQKFHLIGEYPAVGEY